jgi:benzoyl-CoA 2,3-dioxygenase component B
MAPGYIDWWMTMGRGLSRRRTSICAPPSASIPRVGPSSTTSRCRSTAGASAGAAQEDAAVNFGTHKGEKAWQEVPGEYRAMLRRLIVIQGDTEPASVEQQRHLGKTAPSLYDMRNLFQVNVEEGRTSGRWSICCRKYFGKDGREEAEGCCSAGSGDSDKPRMLGAFNERRRTGCPSSCSPSSPIATARCSSKAWRNRASIRCRAPAASC